MTEIKTDKVSTLLTTYSMYSNISGYLIPGFLIE